MRTFFPHHCLKIYRSFTINGAKEQNISPDYEMEAQE